MASMPRVTSREEMVAVRESQGPKGGERLINSNIFLTSAFSGGSTLQDSFYKAPGQPKLVVDNDDSYRQSRHLLNGVDTTGSHLNEENLREHSLARQLQTKEDRPATIRLIRRLKPEELAQRRSTENTLPWVNLIPPNTKFFLEQVQENREEKVQVIDTFGEWIAFFFGRKPEVYSYAGTLLNAQNHDWKNEFQMNYDLFLRGSQAVKYKATVLLNYDDVLVEGYILNTSIQMTGMANNAVPFSFNMLVINRSPVNYRSIIGLRLERSGGTLLEQALFQNLNEALNLTNQGRIDELETFLLMREYFAGYRMPGAGTSVHRTMTGNIEAPISTSPGEIGGATNTKPSPASFEAGATNKVQASGATSEAYGAAGITPSATSA